MASSWKSHTVAQVVPGLDRAEDHKFETRLLRSHLEWVVAAAVCVVLALRQKRLREISFPLALLATVSAVHAVHRPWWNYYYLHLAIPLAWLAGWALKEVIGLIFTLQGRRKFALSSPVTWKALALCALAALVIARSERRLEGTIKELRRRPAADANPIVKRMKAYASRTNWVYAESPIYAFEARLPVPPELAIVVRKRFWSGQITTATIVETCRRYRPELLVLQVAVVGEEWRGLLESDYELASKDAKSLLYAAKLVRER